LGLTPCLRPIWARYQLLSQKKLESLKRHRKGGHRRGEKAQVPGVHTACGTAIGEPDAERNQRIPLP
jgi:hypothetical protein